MSRWAQENPARMSEIASYPLHRQPDALRAALTGYETRAPWGEDAATLARPEQTGLAFAVRLRSTARRAGSCWPTTASAEPGRTPRRGHAARSQPPSRES